ncbi:MAG: hypothetical protein VW879_14495, partial [Opitutae bacterium]
MSNKLSCALAGPTLKRVMFLGTLLAFVSCGGGGGGSDSSGGGSGGGGPQPTNSAPTNISLSNDSAPENQAGSVVGQLSTTDPNSGDTHTYSLGGADASNFTISQNNLALASGFVADFETRSEYSIAITSRDQVGATFSKDFTISIEDRNDAPTITLDVVPEVLENERGTIAFAKAADQDASDQERITFELLGPDGDLFLISGAGLERNIAFKLSPDFEKPSDVNSDRSYEVTVRVSDVELSAEQSFAVMVKNAVEGRVIDAPLSDAKVCLDVNEDSKCQDDEDRTTSDSEGFYNLPDDSVAGLPGGQVLSVGGTDTVTGKSLPSVALVAKLPNNPEKKISITPISTLLAGAEDPDELVSQLGFSEGVSAEDLVELDPWALATSSNDSEKSESAQSLGLSIEEIEAVATKSLTLSAQIVTLVQTADKAVANTTDVGVQTSEERAVMLVSAIAKTITDQAAAAQASGQTLSLEDPTVVQEVLEETVIASAQEISNTIETKQQSGEIDESSLDADTVSAITSLKSDADVITQIGLSEDKKNQVAAISATTANVNKETASVIQQAGAAALADEAAASSLSNLAEAVLVAAQDLSEGKLDVATYVQATDVETLASQDGGVRDVVTDFVESGASGTESDSAGSTDDTGGSTDDTGGSTDDTG